MSIVRHMPPPSSDTLETPLPAFGGGPLDVKNFSWRIVGGVFAILLVLGWIFIIVILIQEEKWQLVLVAWLLLYAAAHFFYWYFKRHHLHSLRSHVCRRLRGNSIVEPIEKGGDNPPSYEEILKSEVPPPAYYSVVVESSKSEGKKSPFSLPKVFGNKISSPRFTRNKGNKSIEKVCNNSTSIITTVTENIPSRYRPQVEDAPPAYVDHLPSTSHPNSTAAASSNGEPIFLPIHNNIEVIEDSTDEESHEANETKVQVRP